MLLLITLVLLVVLASAIFVGTATPDTTSVPINGKDGSADFTIDDGTTARSYKCILDSFVITEIVEMTNADTFCTEGSADQEPGRSQLAFDIGGLLKKDGVNAGPLVPCPQKVAIIATYSTGCFFTFTSNFTRAVASRVVNQNARLAASGLSKGTYSVTWDKTAGP